MWLGQDHTDSEILKIVGFPRGFQVFYVFVLFPQHIVIYMREEAVFFVFAINVLYLHWGVWGVAGRVVYPELE